MTSLTHNQAAFHPMWPLWSR